MSLHNGRVSNWPETKIRDRFMHAALHWHAHPMPMSPEASNNKELMNTHLCCKYHPSYSSHFSWNLTFLWLHANGPSIHSSSSHTDTSNAHTPTHTVHVIRETGRLAFWEHFLFNICITVVIFLTKRTSNGMCDLQRVAQKKAGWLYKHPSKIRCH